jgi:hypothetical protein
MITPDKKKFQTLKRKVLKAFPNAKTHMTKDGLYYVSNGDGGIVGEELLIPAQPNVMNAWYWAAESVKIEKNIERTSPNRMSLDSFEKKFERISNRNKKY